MQKNSDSREATANQLSRLMTLFIGERPTKRRLQDFIEAWDLVKIILNCPNLFMVSRKRLEELFKPQKHIPWISVDKYIDLIMARGKLRGWLLTQQDADGLRTQLHDHYHPYIPTTVDITLGKGFGYDIKEMVEWLKDVAKPFGFDIRLDIEIRNMYPLFYNGIKGKPKLDVEELDIGSYYGQGVEPISYQDVCRKAKVWAAISLIVLLALNPQVLELMGENESHIANAGVPDFVLPWLTFAGPPAESVYIYRTKKTIVIGLAENYAHIKGAAFVARRNQT